MSTVLLADDDKLIIEILTDALELKGYNVLQATNGVEALDKLKHFHPDIIVCDIAMPKLDGYEVLAEAKKNVDTFNIPFIFLTALESKVREGMNLGADDFLAKPISIEVLVAAIESHLSKKRAEQRFYDKKNEEFKQNIIRSLPHEFRTPLNGIIGFSNLIVGSGDNININDIKLMASEISNSGNRLLRLVHNYTHYISLYNQQQNSSKEATDVPLIHLQNAIHFILNKYAFPTNRRKDFVVNIASNAKFKIKEEDLIHIIDNLLDNAFKFSKEGEAVIISAEERDDSYKLVFYNEGRGLSQEEVKAISPLVQFERKTYEQQGVGLGLAIVKLICLLNDVKITFEGEKFKFARIILEFKKIAS